MELTSAHFDAPPAHEEIAVCAYLIWEREGRLTGGDQEHWYHAEAQLHACRAHDGRSGETDREAHHGMNE